MNRLEQSRTRAKEKEQQMHTRLRAKERVSKATFIRAQSRHTLAYPCTRTHVQTRARMLCTCDN
eukprot:3807399-Pleurochrysis_carterae.AAC.1